MARASAAEVVVGIDGSDESRAALRWAARYAGRLERPLTAVAVWQDQLQFGPTVVFPEPEFEAEALQWLERALADVPDEQSAETITTHVGRGDPVQVLVELSRGAEALVLGNHGRGALAGALLGSVALGCAHRAHCPVVLVRADPQPEAE